MSRCRFTLQAEQDLTELCTFIAQDNPQAASAMLVLVEAKCQLIAQHPEIGRRRDDLAASLRSFPAGSYVVFYRAAEGETQIIRILHGSRDVESEFK